MTFSAQLRHINRNPQAIIDDYDYTIFIEREQKMQHPRSKGDQGRIPSESS